MEVRRGYYGKDNESSKEKEVDNNEADGGKKENMAIARAARQKGKKRERGKKIMKRGILA